MPCSYVTAVIHALKKKEKKEKKKKLLKLGNVLLYHPCKSLFRGRPVVGVGGSGYGGVWGWGGGRIAINLMVIRGGRGTAAGRKGWGRGPVDGHSKGEGEVGNFHFGDSRTHALTHTHAHARTHAHAHTHAQGSSWHSSS